jgi:hypothetical protein
MGKMGGCAEASAYSGKEKLVLKSTTKVGAAKTKIRVGA